MAKTRNHESIKRIPEHTMTITHNKKIRPRNANSLELGQIPNNDEAKRTRVVECKANYGTGANRIHDSGVFLVPET